MQSPESTSEAYDRCAPIYDESNAQNDYEMWLGEAVLPHLEKRGLKTGWALDVGCGTGRAFGPLLDRGWKIVGCDVSAGMLAEAERKYGTRVKLLHLDATALRPISFVPATQARGMFDLVLLLNDVVNYLTEDGDLEKVFQGVKLNLRDGGLVAFDANTISLYRDAFASGVAEEMGARGWEWQGLTQEAGPGLIYEARLSGPGVQPHTHRQRHWPADQIQEALAACDLRCLDVLGQREEDDKVLLSASPDEGRDPKLIYIVGHAALRRSSAG